MSELKEDVRKFLEIENEEKFNQLSNDELLDLAKKKLEERMNGNPNEMRTVYYPNKLLTEKCEKVEKFDTVIQTFARHLLIHCRRQGGLGLAAPQVGLLYRIVVVDTEIIDNAYSTDYVKKDYPNKLFNPVISNTSGKIRYKEGCLSIPGVFAWVDRYQAFTINYQDENGNEKKLDVTCAPGDPYGIVLQHEVDHLDGVQFIDRLNFFEKDKIINKMNKFREKK
jgi:peptide deformylase